jgi:hypothetical protein
MTIYHQLTDDAWKRARTEGLFRDTRGEKGDDEAVRRTDLFLDERLPRSLEASLVSRCRVIYGYLGDEENLLDIQTGDSCPVKRKAQESGRVLLRLEVDPSVCWVSDLDLYDTVKNTSGSAEREHAAATYWRALQPLGRYDGTIRRPEVMVTTDLSPDRFSRV